jgi:hypothetical protein
MKGDRNTVLKRTHMILNMKDNPKTFHQAMSSRDVVFWKETLNDEINSIV